MFAPDRGCEEFEFVPNSADKSPEIGPHLDEESDVIELTEEVSKNRVAPSELDGLSLEMPAFRVPESVLDEELDGETNRLDAQSLEDAGYDRQEMVKTISMKPVRREDLEAMAPSRAPELDEPLSDARFAPDIVTAPPRVLIKRWNEGLPLAALKLVSAPPPGSPPPVVAAALAAGSEAPPAPVEPALDEDSDVLELDEIETIQEPPARPPAGAPTAAPPTPELPATPDPEQRQAPDVSAAEPEPTPAEPASAESAASSEPAAGDSEMQGLVKELLEEKKAKAQGPRTKRLRPRDVWFQEVFSEEYLRTIPASIGERTEQEVEFIRKSLKLKRGSRILDLACGFGRHAIGLAEQGYEMVGVDLSMPLLQKALADARQRSTNVKFIHGDMRELNFNEVFDGCYVWDTSVGYFDDRTNLRVFQGIQRALKPGGRILVDVINRDYVVRETPTRLWWEGEGCIFLEESEFDFQTSTLHAKRSFIYEDNSPPLEQNSYIRLYNVHELRQMLHVAGFNVLEISGERFTRGYFLGASSRRVIVLAEKRARKDTV
ncbi:class I SAM-dependent methyltransferase [Lujinxingia vulgaris]|uniref:Class I SAM-dependent methyltransferase n=1 Tax=Lujinxingia vulgaris TaxID=2600176 RepID=A0A5C6XBF9_9DELT|nr:class I SAM-dependent methyltransferase [Lujinxingia vulgaris]TXD39246.1 class I SAM-dependent methyltransferase [Lujinxingia vulgaris]